VDEVAIDVIRRASAIVADVSAETGDTNAAAGERIDFAANSARFDAVVERRTLGLGSLLRTRAGRSPQNAVARRQAETRGSADDRLPISRIDNE
jgi:hypothetical protein